jgi:nitroreductase
MALDAAGLDLLLREARTHNKFTDQPVTDDELRELHNLLKQGPTSANCSPARFLFLRTQEAKRKLAPALSSGNHDKTMAAPVTVIVAYDPKFYEKLPKLFPHNPDATSWFASNDSLAATTAFRNGTGWIPERCPASTMPWWTSFFWLTAAGGPTSCATSVMAIPRDCSHGRRASISAKRVCCCNRRKGSQGGFAHPGPRRRAGAVRGRHRGGSRDPVRASG